METHRSKYISHTLPLASKLGGNKTHFKVELRTELGKPLVVRTKLIDGKGDLRNRKKTPTNDLTDCRSVREFKRPEDAEDFFDSIESLVLPNPDPHFPH